MVANGRNESRWGSYAALGIAIVLVAAADSSGQPISARANQPSANHESHSGNVPPASPPAALPVIIKVEPSSQEVEAAARYESA